MAAAPVGDAPTSVSWDQVMAFRLRRHQLHQRGPRSSLASILREMGGAQAQLPPAAFQSLWTRAEALRSEDAEQATWKDRTLARAWCMRRTAFLLASDDVATFVRGTARRAEKEIRWMRGKGVSEPRLEGLLSAVLGALDRPVTQSEMAQLVGRALGLKVEPVSGGGWGNRRKMAAVRFDRMRLPANYLLHLAGARGVICSGPSRGSEATFVRAESWIPGYREVTRTRAERALLRRYLRAFGPASPQEFAWWTGVRFADARETWSLEESNLSPVVLGGRKGWVLNEDLSELRSAEIEPPTVRLLPYFDSFLLGHPARDHIVSPTHRVQVYRAQGWIYPVVLVNGRARGIWSQRRKGGVLQLHIRPFLRLSEPVAQMIRREGIDLGRFLGVNRTEVRIGRGIRARSLG